MSRRRPPAAAAAFAVLAACSGSGAGSNGGVAAPASSSSPSTGASAPTTTSSPPSISAPPVGPDLREPQELRSVDGVLATTLVAAERRVEVGGREVRTMTYNGSFPGPTLRIEAGDDLRVELANEVRDATNLHTHGLHTSPVGMADNVLHHLAPGQTWHLDIPTSDDLVPGLYWYHAHNHGDTEEQVTAGLAGALVAEGPLDDLPGVADVPERLLLVQGAQFAPDGAFVPVAQQSTTTITRYVNGQLNPAIRMRPGETQRWRVANLMANDFMDLSLDGHRLHQIAADAYPFDEVVAQDSIVMAPANRVEVLVRAGRASTYQLRAGSFAGSASAVLATLVVEGDPVPERPLPTKLLPFEDLRDAPVDGRRTITFSNHQDTGWAVIDGKAFDHHRVDQVVRLGSLEEWTIRNDSDFWHPFHIHINDFQVVEVNGEPQQAHGWQDTVPLPPDGSVTIRMRFTDYVGKAVYHCHILNHEDLGMMAIFEVTP